MIERPLAATDESALSRREARVGRDAAEMVEKTMGLVEDEALMGYVRQIGARLAEHSTRNVEYRFFIVDMPEPNATPSFGGVQTQKLGPMPRRP